MIVNRRTFNIVPGKVEEVIEYLKVAGKEVDWLGNVRLYKMHTGTFDQIVLEYEFDSLAQYETFWTNWFASEAAAGFFQFWRQVSLPGGTNELFEMVVQFSRKSKG